MTNIYYYVVYPCSQWRTEYPHEVACFVWTSFRFAMECKYDTGGYMVKVRIRTRSP